MKLLAVATAALLASDAGPPAITLQIGCVDGLPALLLIRSSGPGERTVRLLDLIERCEAIRPEPPPKPATPT